jgi:PAS domain S-box-containing protein
MKENIEGFWVENDRPFRLLAENLPVVAAYLDKQYRFTQIYPFNSEPLNFQVDSFLGKTPRELGCPVALTRIFSKTFARVFQTGKPESAEFKYATAPDNTRKLRVMVTPTFTDNGTVNTIIMTTHDLTGEKRTQEPLSLKGYDFLEYQRYGKALMESEPSLRLALERAGVGIWTWNQDYGWLSNPQINILFGRAADASAMNRSDFLSQIHPDDIPHLIKAWLGLVEEKRSYYQEYRVFWPDGSIHWLSSKGLVSAGTGDFKRFEGITLDITEHKKAEEKIHHQNAILEGINRIFREALICESEMELGKACLAVAEELTQSKIGFILEVNFEKGIDNIAFCEFGGEKNWRHFEADCLKIPNDLRIHSLLYQVIRDGKSFFTNGLDSHNDSVALPEGYPRFSSFLGAPLIHKDKIIGLIGLGNRKEGYRPDDIETLETLTHTIVEVFLRKRAEVAQLKSQFMLETVIASMTDGLAIVDTQGNYITINDALVRINKFKNKSEYLTHVNQYVHLIEAYTLDGRQISVEELPVWKALRGEILTDYELMGKHKETGETWVVSYSSAPVRDLNGNIIAAVSTAREITAQREAAEVLRESEEKLRLAIEAAQLGTWDWRLEGDELGCSERCRKFFAFEPDEIITYDRLIDRIHPDDRDRINYFLLEALLYKLDYDVEMKVLWPDNTIHWVAMKGLAWYSATGQAIRMAGIALDISERKQAEEELLASERELLKVTLNSLVEAVVAVDQQEQIILMNESAAILTGYSQLDAVGKPFNEVFRIRDGKAYQTWEQILSAGVSSSLWFVTQDLREIPIELNSSPIRAAGRTIGRVLVFQDISTKQKVERELLRTEKLRTLGALAGGIAHDFNNILAAILCNIQLAIIKLKRNEEIQTYLSNTIETTRKASSLTKQLLTFSQGGAPVKKDASLNELIKDTAEFVLRGSKTKAEFDIPDDLWAASIDIGQISQVINNLVINAQQAMPLGGIIHIQAENTVIDGSTHFKPGKYVKIMILDHGSGISPANLPKIFDPFFTTKKEGNGLGLATSYSIISQHNGYIEVESEEGSGTSFFIYLPALEIKIPQSKPTETVEISGDGYKILVMDDEVNILHAVGEMLTCYGYKVVLAIDGVEAISLYKQAKIEGDPFDAIIMDLTVPGGMGGQEAFIHLRKFDSQVKAIISSGYADDPIMADFERYGFVGVVTKPYKIDELNEVLLKIIDSDQLPLDLVY